MKYFITGFILLFFVLQAPAQQVKVWSLQECIDYAKEHNIEIQMRKINIDKQEVALNTAQNRRLPNLSASASQSFSFGRSASGYDNTYQDRNSQSTQWSASTSVPLFTGFMITNEIAASKLDLQAVAAELERVKQDMEINIASMYLQVLYCKEILGITKIQIELSHEQFDRTKKLLESERATQAQIYEVEALIANDELSVVQATSDLRMAILTLTQALELPSPEGFDVTELADALDVILVRNPNAIYESALTSRAAIRAEELRLQSSEKYVKLAQSSFYPTLSFSAGYSNNYYSMSGIETPLFSSQLRNNRNEYFGLNLQIPIFNRYATRNNVKTAQMNYRLQALQLDNSKKSLYKEIQQAYYNALSASEKYKSAESAYLSAEKSFGFMKIRLETERATMYEYNDSKTSMTRALSNRTQAKYDFIFRKKILEYYERQ